MANDPEPKSTDSTPMAYVLLPPGSVVTQNGIPVRLITGALVSVAEGNMASLVGHFLAPVPSAPTEPPPR